MGGGGAAILHTEHAETLLCLLELTGNRPRKTQVVMYVLGGDHVHSLETFQGC